MPQDEKEAKSIQPIQIDIDPLALGEHEELLHRFFLEEETKEKGEEKNRVYFSLEEVEAKNEDPNQPKSNQKKYYPFEDDDGTSYKIHFTQPLFRRKKSYRQIVELKNDGPPPEQKEREKNTLYIKPEKFPGTVSIYTADNEHGIYLNQDARGKVQKKQAEIEELTKDGCQVFLMRSPTPESDIKITDQNHLYAYFDSVRNEIYIFDNEGKEQRIRTGFGISPLLFDQPAENPQECDDRQLIKSLLRYSSTKKYTLPDPSTLTPEEAHHKKITAIMSACVTPVNSNPINRYVYNIIGKRLGKGGQGAIHISPGKLEHSDGKMVSIDYATSTHTRIRNGVEQDVDRREKILKIFRPEKEQPEDKRTPAEKNLDLKRQFAHNQNVLRQTDNESQAKKTTIHKEIGYSLQGLKKGKDLHKTLNPESSQDENTSSTSNKTDLAEIISLLHRQSSLSKKERTNIIIESLKAINSFHKKGFIHRDIKPRNMMVELLEKDQVTVKLIDSDMAIKENYPASYHGTPIYVPPEISARKKPHVEKSHDAYAIGMTILEILMNPAFKNRKKCLRNHRDIDAYHTAEHHLNVSIYQPVSSPRDKQNENVLYNVAVGLTATDENERMTIEEALQLLDPSLQDEKKEEEKKRPPCKWEIDETKAIENLNKLDRKAKLLFLNEVITNIEALTNDKTVPIQGENKAALDESLYLLIQAQKYDMIPDNKITDTIIDAARMLSFQRYEKAGHALSGNEFSEYPKKIKEHIHKPYSDYLKKAWNETFLPGLNQQERKDRSFAEYFLGWPAGKDRFFAKFTYFFWVGWIITPVKNALIKLPLEFSLKLLSESFHYLHDKTSFMQPRNYFLPQLAFLGFLIAETARFFTSTITSPIANYRRAKKEVSELGAIVAIAVVATVVIVVVALYVAPILLPIIGIPVLSLLGIAATPILSSMIGAATLLTLPLVNTFRELITEKTRPRIVKIKEPKKIVEPPVVKKENQPSVTQVLSTSRINKLTKENKAQDQQHEQKHEQKTHANLTLQSLEKEIPDAPMSPASHSTVALSKSEGDSTQSREESRASLLAERGPSR